MRQTTYTSKPAGAPSQKLIGGGKALNISGLRSISTFLLFLFIVSFLCTSCEEETSVLYTLNI